MQYTISIDEKKLRLDQFLQNKLTELSRTQIQSLITNKQVLVNQEPIKKNYRLAENDEITVILESKEEKLKLEAISEPLTIVYEDTDIIVIDKPPFLPVHPDEKFNHRRTLVNLLLGNKIKLSNLGGNLRPGIVHRLDMDTSGLIVIAKTNLGYKTMRKQFEDQQVSKKYLCLTIGQMESETGLIKAPITRNPIDRKKMSVQATQKAKNALSQFKIIQKFFWPEINQPLNLVEVKILTGRTHQIRVHFTSIKHPLLGDTTYGNSKANATAKKIGLKRQFLHAYKLEFLNTANKLIKLESQLPKDLEEFLDKIKLLQS